MKEKIIEYITEKVKDVNGVVVGLSGGIDSTVTLFLCVEALGSDKVLGVMMPSTINRKEDTEDAVQVCKELKVRYLKLL